MVCTNMELGTNNSNNKRKIMKELNIKMKPPSVRKYIDEQFKEYEELKDVSNGWDSCSNYELENNIGDFYEQIDFSKGILKDHLENIYDDDFEMTSTLLDFIKEDEWRLGYETLKGICEDIDFNPEDLDVLDMIVDVLTELISLTNTIYSLKELLIKRSGLIEDITYKSK